MSQSLDLSPGLWGAKTSIPPARPGAVSRAGLVDSGRTGDWRVVGITAPAGYGKTTLLAQWVAIEDRAIAWVSLNRLDDDPGTLLALLASAFAGAVPGNADLVADVGGLGVSALGRAAPRLASALRASPVPFVLVVDDLHELQSPTCHDVLGVVISGVPRGSQFIAASRSEQPHIPRLRAAGDVREFSVGDLAMDAGGAEEIFAAADVRITREYAAAVTERTEGWPVGLYLAALIARDTGNAPTLMGEDPYLADYLYRESLAALPEQVQHFLRSTSVLDRMCAPLCDALFDEQCAQEQLRRLESSNAFLVSLDRRRYWYRYHPLFREFLLGELRRTEPESIAKLHLRAADWYESHGSPELALEHLLEASDQSRSGQLMAQLVLPTYQAGRVSTVQRWLSRFGRSEIEQNPPLAVLAGWIAVMSGQPVDAQHWGTAVEAARFGGPMPDGSSSFDSARAMLRAARCLSGPRQMLADAAFAVAREPEWSAWRDTALVLCAEAHLLCDEADQAALMFAEATAAAGLLGNADNVAIAEAELALMAMDSGHWASAAEHLGVATAAIEEHGMHDYASSVLAFAAAARLAQHRGVRRDVDLHLTEAMRARPSCTYTLPFLAVRVRLQLAKVYQASGDQGTARHLMREVKDVLLHRPDLGLLAQQASNFSDVVAASAQAAARGGLPLTPAELRLLPYLQTHLTIREIGERLFVSRNTVSSEVGSIYRKLGVSTRGEAVRHATAIGLLGG